MIYLYDHNKIRTERARQGKSIKEVAELANLNIKTVIRIEQSKVNPHPQTVGKIAKALNKDIEEFIIKPNL